MVMEVRLIIVKDCNLVPSDNEDKWPDCRFQGNCGVVVFEKIRRPSSLASLERKHFKSGPMSLDILLTRMIAYVTESFLLTVL